MKHCHHRVSLNPKWCFQIGLSGFWDWNDWTLVLVWGALTFLRCLSRWLGRDGKAERTAGRHSAGTASPFAAVEGEMKTMKRRREDRWWTVCSQRATVISDFLHVQAVGNQWKIYLTSSDDELREQFAEYRKIKLKFGFIYLKSSVIGEKQASNVTKVWNVL